MQSLEIKVIFYKRKMDVETLNIQCNIQYKALFLCSASSLHQILHRSDDWFFIHFNGLIGISAVRGKTRIDASLSGLLLNGIGRFFVG